MNEIKQLIHEKLQRIQSIIKHTLSQFNYYRKFEIIANSDVVLCSTTLSECYEKCEIMIRDLLDPKYDTIDKINETINELQIVIDKLSIIMCGYGTKQIEDILFISFGTEMVETENSVWKDKYNLICENVKPIGYKTIHWKNVKQKPKETHDSSMPICSNKMADQPIDMANQYECFEIDMNMKPLFAKIYGVRIVIHSEKTQKTLIIQGIVEDIPLECITSSYIKRRKHEILESTPVSETFIPEIMRRIVDTMTIKDVLIWGNEDVYKKHMGILSEVNYVKYNKLSATIKKFLELDVYGQRHMLINLLIYNCEMDIQYITYLLYDLITSKTGEDSFEQQLIYDSFPWKIKLFFKETMKNTIKYTKDIMSKYDINRISLEQQIYVMKVPEQVKEKAIMKLKEIKGKSDDNGGKAKQYLEGLLKIPFGVYREESVLTMPKHINTQFLAMLTHVKIFQKFGVPVKTRYNMVEITQCVRKFEEYMERDLPAEILETLKDSSKITTKQTNAIFEAMTSKKSGLPKDDKLRYISNHLKDSKISQISDILYASEPALTKTVQDVEKLKSSTREIKTNLDQITSTLDESIHGHRHAKDQILKIAAQWMNGEQSGYCFGFEGSPGIGKTSLAKKGLSQCLKDANGESRPFAFIALGGSCNGSTLEGHSYTYVNSMWGKIVDILMDSKCMNPIIYVDELDKVSKTEHGKEIIGILTHLIDMTQNSVFQDKYFSGIDIDLSKVLFIFSYNDPSQIDSILLDRIHRIKFDSLSLEEKIVVVKKYMIPEIDKKMGLDQCVFLSDEVIEYIIETYTLESGVRKLKEIVFDLYGEINVRLLKCDTECNPLHITINDLQNIYLSKYDKIVEKTIHAYPETGVINGLWANSFGRGGIIPIQAMFFPTSTFLELRLTGMQGDVMKESMNVAKTLAWTLLSTAEQEKLVAMFEKTKCQGLHIHCPEGAVSKDGPSAGAAITLTMYSLFTSRPINNTVAMTGEINLQGQVTEIGGLEHKIIGGVKAGVLKFLYPESNKRDFDKFWKKMGGKPWLKDIVFVPVSNIKDTFTHFLELV